MPATPAPRVGLYARISRDKTGAGLSVERQNAECEELADKLGWPIAERFTDNDLSAYSGKPRPGYRRLLGALEQREIDTVICWHTDRLHRSPAELEEWIAVCEPRGVAVFTVKAGPIDLATPSGRMVARALGAVARFESEHRSERVAAKMDAIAKAGGFLGGVRPFGYLDGGMELHPVEADLVRTAIRDILRGGSLRAVAKRWNELGVTSTKAGLRWTPSACSNVLTRPRNAGLLEHRGQVVGPASWPAIVTEDEWRGVCTVLSDPARRTSKGHEPRWLGSGLYRCSVCGEGMVVGTSGQVRIPSYKCRSSERGGSRHVTRQAVALDEFVERVIVGRLSLDDARDVFAPRHPDVDALTIRGELARIEEHRAQLATRLGEGEISMAMMDAANRPLTARKTALEASLAAAVIESPIAHMVTSEDVDEAWRILPLAQRRLVLDALMVVTVLPAPRGRQPDGSYFNPAYVQIVWKTR